MSQFINIDRFTRLNQSLTGIVVPQVLPRLAEFLAAKDGEIRYSLIGKLTEDLSGSQKRRLKCIIRGWFLVFDPVTLAPVRHDVDINSSLILVKDESELPPLEMESATEDYIVCGEEMDVAERIEEEILLDLPAQSVDHIGLSDSIGKHTRDNRTYGPDTAKTPKVSVAESLKISPFAKLAELKKK